MTEMTRDKLIREVKLRLGDGMIDLDLDPDHYDYAVTAAIDRYRVRSGNALEESFLFMDIQPEVSVYTLPNEVQEVLDVYRRGMQGTGQAGGQIDPFSQAFTNSIYLTANPSGMGGGGGGTLLTYELAMQYQELIGRMFGRDVQFTWNAASKKILFHRRFAAMEQIALHIYNTKPEQMLLSDPYSRPWIRDYTVAQCKLMLGEARSKYQSLAGPQGGISLNGDALKAEAKEELDRLETEIQNYVEGHQGYGFVIG